MTKQVAIITIPNRTIKAGEYNGAYGHNTAHLAIFEQYVKLPKSATSWNVFTGSNIEVNIEYTGKISKRNMDEIQRFISHGFILEANIDGVELVEKPAPTEEPEIVSTPKAPRPFIIREEAHPLRAGASCFRVYYADMTPLYIGRETVEEAEKALRDGELVSSIQVIYLNEPAPVEEVVPVTIIKVTVYEKNEKTYCEDCKPKNGKKSTLSLSSPDRVFCSGCGNDLYGDDDDLSPSDLAAIEHAMSQPDLGPFTMEELTQLLTQAQKPAIGSLVRLKGSLVDRTWRITRYYADGYWFVCERGGEPENPYRTRVWNVDDVEVVPEPPQPDNRCPNCQTPTMIKQCYGCGTVVCVYCGSFVRERWHCLQCCLHGYEKPYHERGQELQSETLYTVADDRLTLPVHYLTPNAVSPTWYSPKRFSGIKEASDAFVAYHGKPARYVDPYQFGVLCKLRMDEWETRESALDCGILPTEGQAVTFDTSVPY